MNGQEFTDKQKAEVFFDTMELNCRGNLHPNEEEYEETAERIV